MNSVWVLRISRNKLDLFWLILGGKHRVLGDGKEDMVQRDAFLHVEMSRSEKVFGIFGR